MRAQLTVTLALMMGFSALHAQDVKALVQAYEAQADQIAAKLLFAEFAKHATAFIILPSHSACRLMRKAVPTP
jgi:hypothetical protein